MKKLPTLDEIADQLKIPQEVKDLLKYKEEALKILNGKDPTEVVKEILEKKSNLSSKEREIILKVYNERNNC